MQTNVYVTPEANNAIRAMNPSYFSIFTAAGQILFAYPDPNSWTPKGEGYIDLCVNREQHKFINLYDSHTFALLYQHEIVNHFDKKFKKQSVTFYTFNTEKCVVGISFSSTIEAENFAKQVKFICPIKKGLFSHVKPTMIVTTPQRSTKLVGVSDEITGALFESRDFMKYLNDRGLSASTLKKRGQLTDEAVRLVINYMDTQDIDIDALICEEENGRKRREDEEAEKKRKKAPKKATNVLDFSNVPPPPKTAPPPPSNKIAAAFGRQCAELATIAGKMEPPSEEKESLSEDENFLLEMKQPKTATSIMKRQASISSSQSQKVNLKLPFLLPENIPPPPKVPPPPPESGAPQTERNRKQAKQPFFLPADIPPPPKNPPPPPPIQKQEQEQEKESQELEEDKQNEDNKKDEDGIADNEEEDNEQILNNAEMVENNNGMVENNNGIKKKLGEEEEEEEDGIVDDDEDKVHNNHKHRRKSSHEHEHRHRHNHDKGESQAEKQCKFSLPPSNIPPPPAFQPPPPPDEELPPEIFRSKPRRFTHDSGALFELQAATPQMQQQQQQQQQVPGAGPLTRTVSTGSPPAELLEFIEQGSRTSSVTGKRRTMSHSAPDVQMAPPPLDPFTELKMVLARRNAMRAAEANA